MIVIFIQHVAMRFSLSISHTFIKELHSIHSIHSIVNESFIDNEDIKWI